MLPGNSAVRMHSGTDKLVTAKVIADRTRQLTCTPPR